MVPSLDSKRKNRKISKDFRNEIAERYNSRAK